MSKDNGGPASDKIQQARLAAFEAWWYKTDVLDMNKMELAEASFNAALDCVVIELPDAWNHPNPQSYEMGCSDAIESTNLGIKVK